MRNSFILYKKVRDLVLPIHEIELALIADYHNPTLSQIWQDTLDLTPHRTTVYESSERKIYTLITTNHPAVEKITAKACYRDDLRDYWYTVTITYRDNRELLINPDQHRLYNNGVYTVKELGY